MLFPYDLLSITHGKILNVTTQISCQQRKKLIKMEKLWRNGKT